jgi:hypothetical protein
LGRVCAEAVEMLRTRQRRVKPKLKRDDREGKVLKGVGEHALDFFIIDLS